MKLSDEDGRGLRSSPVAHLDERIAGRGPMPSVMPERKRSPRSPSKHFCICIETDVQFRAKRVSLYSTEGIATHPSEQRNMIQTRRIHHSQRKPIHISTTHPPLFTFPSLLQRRLRPRLPRARQKLISTLLHPHLPLHLQNLLLLTKRQRPRHTQQQRTRAHNPQRLATQAQSPRYP